MQIQVPQDIIGSQTNSPRALENRWEHANFVFDHWIEGQAQTGPLFWRPFARMAVRFKAIRPLYLKLEGSLLQDHFAAVRGEQKVVDSALRQHGPDDWKFISGCVRMAAKGYPGYVTAKAKEIFERAPDTAKVLLEMAGRTGDGFACFAMSNILSKEARKEEDEVKRAALEKEARRQLIIGAGRKCLDPNCMFELLLIHGAGKRGDGMGMDSYKNPVLALHYASSLLETSVSPGQESLYTSAESAARKLLSDIEKGRGLQESGKPVEVTPAVKRFLTRCRHRVLHYQMK